MLSVKCLALLVTLVNVNASGKVWLKDIISPNGLDLGYGVVLKVNESHKGVNVPIMERLTLDLSLGGLVGVSVAKAKSDGLELDFYVKNNKHHEEGRGKKDEGNKYMLPMMIGYKVAVLASAAFAMIKALALKALFVAKAALIISLFVLILKLKDRHPPEIIEVEQHGYPSYGSHYVGKDLGYQGYGHNNYGKEAQSSNVYPDIVYAPSGAAAPAPMQENAGYVPGNQNEAPVSSAMSRKGQEIERKRDSAFYNKLLNPNGSGNLLSITKYGSPET